MAERVASRSIMVVADACLRLLVLLTATFLVYEIALRTTEAVYHPLYRYWHYLRGLLLLQPGVTAQYVTIARSHGLSAPRLFAYHIRRPLLARLLSDLAANLPLFVTYLVIVELAYRYTGIGYYTVLPYTRFFGMRGEEAFTVSQAALVYVGAITVLLQLVFRLGGLWLVPSLRTTDTERQAQITRAIGAGAVVMLLGALLHPLLGATTQAAGVGRVVAAIAVAWLAILLRRHRGTPGVDRPQVRGIALAGGGEGTPEYPPEYPPVRSWFATVRPVTVAVCACVVALIVLPWLLPPPERPPVLVMFRPNIREHPFLIWYFFLRTLIEGRFLLVVLVAAIIGSSVGALLGIVAGYFRSHALDRAMAYLHVFPSILVVVLVVGLSEAPGLPVFVALVVAAAVRSFADSRDFGVVLRKTDFVRYGVSIGEGPLEQLYRHVLPNLVRGYGARLLDLYVDLIVLTANLSFLRLLPVGPGAPTPGASGFLRHAGALTDEWGRLLADARSDFIKGIYLPALWPFVLLIVTIYLVRALASRWEAR